MLAGGLTGLLSGIGLQEWVHQIAYPINIAGKPLNSWPQFVPVTFELTILFAALAGVLGMIILNGLPMPYHPVFNVAAFRARQPRQVLPAGRVDRPEVRSHADPQLPQGAQPERGERS